MQKCLLGAERVSAQLRSFWHPCELLANCLLIILPFGRKKQASRASFETSIPIQASMVSLVLNLVCGISRLRKESSQVTVRDDGHRPAGLYLTYGVSAPRNLSHSYRPAGAWDLLPRMLTHKESAFMSRRD